MDSIYGSHLPEMKRIQQEIQTCIDALRQKMKEESGLEPVEHCLSRIKSEDSMREKCRRRGIPETTESALRVIHDAIGFRIVCAFLNDVYLIRDTLTGLRNYKLVEEKDYIQHVKPNGYRSLHLILQEEKGYYVEFQLRTISMDTWAALEHQLKYKRNLSGNENLIVAELKSIADTLASTDISMQTIRDMIQNG